MEDCGSRRCVLGADAEGELVRAVAVLVDAVVVVLSESLLALLLLFLSILRGASLIKPASLRWWSSSRLRMRRACVYKLKFISNYTVMTYLLVMCVLRSIVEEGGCMVVLVPRSRDAAAQSGCLRITHMFVGSSKVRRLHGMFGMFSCS